MILETAPRCGFKLRYAGAVHECRTLLDVAEKLADVWYDRGPERVRVTACVSLTQDRELWTRERAEILALALKLIGERAENGGTHDP